MDDIEILKKQMAREKLARKEAESILEKKSSELYEVNQKLQKVVNNLALQHAVSLVLTNASSQEIAARKILQIMSDILNMKVANMWTAAQDGYTLNLYASHCIEEPAFKKFIEDCKPFSFLPGVGLPGKVFQSKEIEQIKDVTKDTNFPRAPFASAAGLHGAFAFPLFIENRVMGVIEFFTDKSKEFDPVLLAIIADIGKQIGIFLEREHARKNMLDAQRAAGITEVTTSMLHNIGNTLNSVNVSISMLEEKFKHSTLDDLLLLRDLVKTHEHDFTAFILESEQGKHLPHFLIELGNYWQNEQKKIKQEILSLSQSVRHINDILKSQQFLSGSFGMVEPMQINNLLDDAVRINSFTLPSANVVIQRKYEDLPLLLVDRIKLLQILINLVRNAFQAIANNHGEKKIVLQTKIDKKMVTIQVSDNGNGIEKSNQLKIFTHGYTTKKEGHGFGLHASAISAQEMGGNLTVESDGINKGATFSLTLPYKLSENHR